MPTSCNIAQHGVQTNATCCAQHVAFLCTGLKDPCKRTQHCWSTTPNIVGPNNVVTCSVRLHGTMLALVAYSLKPVKLLGPCKRTQQCWPTPHNNVGSCWHLLRPFAWTLTLYLISCDSDITSNLITLVIKRRQCPQYYISLVVIS